MKSYDCYVKTAIAMQCNLCNWSNWTRCCLC